MNWGLFTLLLITACVLTWAIVTQYNEAYMRNDPILKELRDDAIRVDPRIGNLPLYAAEKSYTINKEKTFLCLRDENGEYYSRNMLMYVLLHEFAHVINEEIGHPPSFYKVFDDLLKKAEAVGVWDRDIPIVKDYCMYND
jgi:hypothetical protein